MHDHAYNYVRDTVEALGLEPTSVVEFGSRDINGSVRPIFRSALAYTGVDVEPGPGADVVCPAEHYSRATPVDVVVCTEVLEHTAAAPEIIANAYEMLVDGGVFIMTCAGPGRQPHSAVDGGHLRPGEFYRNVSAADAEEWLTAAGFTEWEIDERVAGDLRLWAKR